MKKALALLLFAFSFCFALNFNEQINDEAHIFSQNERDELLNLSRLKPIGKEPPWLFLLKTSFKIKKNTANIKAKAPKMIR